MHIAIVGMGRVGQTLAFQLLHENFFEELSLVDAQNGSGRASGAAIDLEHAAGSLKCNACIHSLDSVDDLSTAEVIIVTAGKPAEANQGRRHLVSSNSIVISNLARKLGKSNPDAKYIIVTNPVDAMSTLFQKESGASSVISSGCHIDSLRLRSELAKFLGLDIGSIEAFVGGEHGVDSVFLWSTARVHGISLSEYLKNETKEQDMKHELERLVRERPEDIIRTLGGVVYGPACAVADIARVVSTKQKVFISIGLPFRSPKLEESVHVSRPVSFTNGDFITKKLTEEEDDKIERAAMAVLDIYRSAESFAHVTTI